MNNQDAEKLSIALLQVLDILNQTADFVKDKDSEENWEQYRKAVGKVMGGLCLDLSEPLYSRFPELKPEQLGGSYKIDKSIYESKFDKP